MTEGGWRAYSVQVLLFGSNLHCLACPLLEVIWITTLLRVAEAFIHLGIILAVLTLYQSFGLANIFRAHFAVLLDLENVDLSHVRLVHLVLLIPVEDVVELASFLLKAVKEDFPQLFVVWCLVELIREYLFEEWEEGTSFR